MDISNYCPCMLGEALTLAAIGSFAKDLFLSPARDALQGEIENRVKERWFTRRTAEQTVFYLYQELEKLTFVTSDYVEVLRQLVDVSESFDRAASGMQKNLEGSPESAAGSEEAEYFALCRDLHESLKEVLESIRNISFSITQLGIGFEIHQSSLIATVRRVGVDRSAPLPVSDPINDFLEEPEQNDEFWSFVNQRKDALRDRLGQAEENLNDIKAAGNSLREFLAAQFTFREMITIAPGKS